MTTKNSRNTNAPSDTAALASHADDDRATEAAMRHAQASMAEAGAAAKVLADHGVDAVRRGSARVEDTAARISDRASTYIQEQPLKSLLIATAAGALIAIATGMAGRR